MAIRISEPVIKENKLEAILRTYLEALINASGITEDQARICVLYALCTYRTDLEAMPVLAIIGSTGTGKSRLLSEMFQLVNQPKRATGTTSPYMRDEMVGCPTYVIDEADRKNELLIQLRTSRTTSIITHNVGTREGWKSIVSDIYGATMLARRTPFRDAALRNRSILISTQNNPGEYFETKVKNLSTIFNGLSLTPIKSSGRVADTWNPLLEVAQNFEGTCWTEAIKRATDADHAAPFQFSKSLTQQVGTFLGRRSHALKLASIPLLWLRIR